MKKLFSWVMVFVTVISSVALLFPLNTYAAEPVVNCNKEAREARASFYSANDILYSDPCATSCNDTSAVTGDTNKAKVWSLLVQKGATEYAAAGIMGNMNNESGFNPFRYQTTMSSDDEVLNAGDDEYNKAWGLVQWDGGRRTAVLKNGILVEKPEYKEYISLTYGAAAEDYTKAPQGVNDYFLQYEIDYLIMESSPGGNRSTVWADINATTSVLDATILFHDDFEGSADSPEQVAESRGAAAQAIYDEFKGSIATTNGGSSVSEDCGEEQAVSGNFVYYSQLDPKWSGSPISSDGGTIGRDGCSTTSMAMIVSTLTDNASVTPVETTAIAVASGGVKGSSVSAESGLFSSDLAANAVANEYGLQTQQLNNLEEIAEYIKAGGYVYIAGAGSLPFTGGGHIVVVKGVDADGGLIIADPYSDSTGNYHPQEKTYSIAELNASEIRRIQGFKK